MKTHETQKHHLIVSAAAARFAKQGYKKTTIDEIVEQAGISKGLFYHYFNNKRELYIHIYEDYVRILSQSIREKVDLNETDFLKRLKQIAHLRIDFIARYPNLWRFLYAAYEEEHPDVAQAIKQKNEELLRESYAHSASNIDWSRLKAGISPDRAIEIVTWLAEGFVRKIERNPMSTPDMYNQFDEYMECLERGIYGRD